MRVHLNSRHFAIFAWIAFGLVAEFFALSLAIDSMGAGHGSYFFTKMFFPFAMAVDKFVGYIPLWIIVPSLVQYPIYGFVIGRSKGWRKRTQAIVLIGLTHLLVVMFTFTK